MKRLGIIITLTSIFVTTAAFARTTFGVLAGGNYTIFSNGVDESFTGSAGTGSGTLGASGLFGYQFGGLVRFDHPRWAIEIDTIYAARSMRWAGQINMVAPDPSFRTEDDISLKQIEVPLIGYYKVPYDGGVVRIGLGIFASYGIGKIHLTEKISAVPGEVESASGDYTWEDFGFRRFNMGGMVVLGTDFFLGETSVLGVELRGETGFTDLKDSINPNFSGGNISTHSIDLMLSYVF